MDTDNYGAKVGAGLELEGQKGESGGHICNSVTNKKLQEIQL